MNLLFCVLLFILKFTIYSPLQTKLSFTGETFNISAQYQHVCTNNRQEGSVAAQQQYQIIVVSQAGTRQ
jgi:hypothetical protein